MKLESGAAAYDRNYNLIIALLGVGLGAYFLYDHYVGYPHKNYEQAAKNLTPILGQINKAMPETLPAHPTAEEAAALIASKPKNFEAVVEALGEPLIPPVSAPDSDVAVSQFVSIYGTMTVRLERGRLAPDPFMWQDWEKSKDDIELQYYCSFVAFAFGVFMLLRALKAASLRVVIDDAGVVYGRRRILFEHMTKLCNYSRKGWVDLYYEHGPEERKLRFDNQKVREFDAIIDALCEAKGFEDPRKAVEDEEDQVEAEGGESEDKSA